MPLLVIAGYGPGISHATAEIHAVHGPVSAVPRYDQGFGRRHRDRLVSAIEPSDVADLPWSMSRSRDSTRTTMSEDAPSARA